MRCRQCGVRTERVEFADPKARGTRRFQQQIGFDYQPCGGPLRGELGRGAPGGIPVLRRWSEQPSKRPPCHLGLDEIQRGKGHQFWTVLSDIVHGEVIALRQDRSEETTTTLLTEALTPQQRGCIQAVCPDRWKPYLNAVAA